MVGLLGHLGHTATLVSTGRKALEALEGELDLILMDVQMRPDIRGSFRSRSISTAR